VVGWNTDPVEDTLVWSNRLARTITGQAAIHCLAAGNDWVLAGSATVGAALIHADTAALETFWKSPGGPITAVALARDESLAALGTRNGAAHLVQASEGRVIANLEAHHDQIQSLAFSRDGRLLASACREGTVCLWRIDDQRVDQLITFRFQTGPVTAVGFGADANRLIVLVHGERALRQWRLDRLHSQLAQMKLGW
jgi:WD40 repeat protein